MARRRGEHVGLDSKNFRVPKLTVACVCVPGGVYKTEHVIRLHHTVREHLSQPFLFSCITASPWPGWWAKIELFKPGRFNGRVLYLDLDVSVVGQLDDLVDGFAPFTIIDEWQNPPGRFNSSVMVWDAGAGEPIYRDFNEGVMERLHGDQAWVHEKMPRAKTFPKEWCQSYKRHIRPRLDGSLPEDCRVVVYHGQPKPWDV